MIAMDQQPCSRDALIGTWFPYKSEIPDYDLTSEIYRFTPEGKFLWEHPHLKTQPKVWSFDYSLEGLTLNYYRGAFKWEPLLAWFEGDSLVFQPVHGHKTYSRRKAEPGGAVNDLPAPPPDRH